MVRFGNPSLILCDHCQYVLLSVETNIDLHLDAACDIICPQCGFITEFSEKVLLFDPETREKTSK